VQNFSAIATSYFENEALVVLRIDQLLIQSDISDSEETSKTKRNDTGNFSGREVL
jgi:hypothetical protein